MDYGALPVTALIRGPLLHTPQGLVVLAASALYLIAATLIAVGLLPAPFRWPTWSTVGLFVFWPFVMFLLFVKWNQPDFRASWPAAVWLLLCALAPIVFGVWHA